jgi:two-component system sensor histidine kinase QseC
MKSIRLQLIIRMLIGTAVILTGSGIFLYFVCDHFLTKQFDATLETRAAALISDIRIDNQGRVELDSQDLLADFSPNPKHFYYRISGPDGTLRQTESLGTQILQPPDSKKSPVYWNLHLDNGRHVRAVLMSFTPHNEFREPGPRPSSRPSGAARGMRGSTTRSAETRPAPTTRSAEMRALSTRPAVTLQLIVAQDDEPLDESLDAVGESIWITAAVVSLGIIATVLLTVKHGLRPLQKLGEEVGAVDAGSLEKRFQTESLSRELQPISDRLNQLLERLQRAFLRERQFSSNVAHELRTPVAELRSLAEVAVKWPTDAQGNQQSFGDVIAIAGQMEAIVTTLLSMARAEAGRLSVVLENVPLSDSIEEVLQNLKADAEKKKLTTRISQIPAELEVRSNPTLLQSILANLLANAIEYSPVGGRIEISAAGKSGQIELVISNTNDTLVAADLEHLFEPFWRKDAARSDSSHSGLGLPLVRAYAKVLGAKISATLDKPDWFSVKLEMPVAIASASATA